MSLVPEVKRRSGFDPHQPRDRKGRWVETGAEVRNSITHAIGTVSRIVRGDAFHENRYEVRTSDGQTQTWETSAVDVVRNRDGSAPSEHAPGSAPNRPAAAHPGATHPGGSRAADAIGQVYAGQAPGKPQAGHSPVDHAVDAVYGQPHPDQPGRVADAVGSVYAAQAPNKPEAGRTPVAHAVDAAHGTPAAPPPGGGFRGQLDDRWHKDGTVIHPHTTLAKLKPGDRIHTEGQGTQASPVTLAKPNPSNGVIPGDRRKTRTVAHVQRNPDSTHTVHFTDGTSTGTEGGSNIPVSDTGRSRVYAADAPDAIVAGGGTPPPPAPGPDVTPPPVRPRPFALEDARNAMRRRADELDAHRPGPGGDFAGHAARSTQAAGLRALADAPDLRVTPEGFVYRQDSPGTLYDRHGNNTVPDGQRLTSQEQLRAYSRHLGQRGIEDVSMGDRATAPQRLAAVREALAAAKAEVPDPEVAPIPNPERNPAQVAALRAIADEMDASGIPRYGDVTSSVRGLADAIDGGTGEDYQAFHDDLGEQIDRMRGDFRYTNNADVQGLLDRVDALRRGEAPVPPARTAPEVPDGPLADSTRAALTAIAGTNGVSDQDLGYYGQRFADLPAGTLTTEEAHARVDDARNSIINTADSGDRAGAMLALDNLDTAIDAHGGPDPLPGFGTPREFTQNDRFSPPRGAWVDIPAAGRRPAVTGIVEYGGRTNASGTRIHVRQDDGSTVERQVKPGETYRVRATPDSVESSARYRVGGMSDADLAAEVERVSDPQTGAAARELAALLDRREQVRSGANAAPPRQAEVTSLWERADDAILTAADRAKTPEDAATLRAASTAFKTSLEEAGYDAPSAEARTLPTRLAGMSDAEVLALNERASRYDGGFPDDAIEFLHADLLRRGYTEDGVPDAGSRVGMTNPQHPSDALVGQRVAFREDVSSDESAWTVGTLTPADAQGNHWLENGDGSGLNSGVRVGPDQYVEPVRPDDPRVDRLDPTEMTAPELDAAIARQQARTTELARTSGVNSPEFRDANSTLQDMARERDSRPDDPFAPVDPGGTTALFGDGADAPEVPQGDPVPASDLSVGDQISYVTADGITVSGEIEGLHTAGPNVVATLRMPDDSRDTRAFKRDAEVVRTAGAPEPPTEDTAAGDLRMGHRVLLQDVTGAYRAATVISKTKDPGGTGLVLEVARDDGTHETVIVDPAEMLPRITDRTTPPEPDLPPMPDPTPDDGTKLVTALQPRDRIASYGDNVTVVRARVAADGLVHARVRLANGAEDDVTYAPDAVVTLADPPSVIRHDPLPVDTASVRPVLYTYQRNGITALNLDATDGGQPPLVQQAAARVRARQALSEEQSAALADALRAQANAPGVRAPRQRTLSRQAAALDAAAAAAGGRVPPVTPNRDTVEKTRPNNLVPGDWVALRSQGTGGGVDVVQVLGSRPMMGGRLHELSVRDQEGNESRRLVAGNADTYLLPDLPRDLPAPPEQPRPEHISVDRLNVGDTIRFTHVDPNTYASTVREGRVTGIATMGGEGSKIVGIHVDVNGSDYMFRQRTNAPDGPNVLVRTARGPASQEQPYDSLLPAENPEVLRSVTDVAVGDRVSVPAVAGVPHVGVVHDIEKVASDDGASGVRMQLRQDDGTVSTVVIFNDDPAKVTRLAKGDEGAAQRIQQMYAERERQLLANAARRKIESFRSQLLTYEVRPNPAGSPEDAAAGVLRGRDDPGAMAQRNIRDSAHEIAGYLSPETTDEAQRALIASRIEPILRQVREEYLTNLADSLRQVPPDQAGYGNYGWTQRVIDQHKQSPSTRDFGRIARTLADAAANLQGGGDNQAMPVVNVPEGSGDLRTRIAAYKAALPGGDAFGKRQVTRTTFKQPTLDDLEAGRVPDTETATTFAPDRAADGGPGETAMAHHDVILAAGRDLQGELNRRMVARDASFGSDPEATLATLKAQRDEARKANSAALNAYYDFGSYDPSTADQRAELRAAYDAASARSKEINDRYQAMTLRLARLRREVAMEIVADHRQTGGVRIDWVDNKGKVLTDRSQLVKAMRQAEDVYPTEWLQRFKDRTKGRFTLKSVKRGYFAEGRGEIALSDKAVKMEGGGNKDDVAVHELGHGMEWVVPGLTAAEEALLWARTSDGPVGSRTRQKKTTIYKGEYGWKDEFPEHYTGKDYGGGFHEVFTTTVESVFAGSSYADANLTQWLLGSMVLL